MRIPELMKAIVTLFPDAFANQDQAGMWADMYRRALGHREGPSLQTAWEQTMAHWTKRSAPLPADIAKNLQAKVSFSPTISRAPEPAEIPEAHVVRDHWRQIPMDELTATERKLCMTANAELLRKAQGNLSDPFKRIK